MKTAFVVRGVYKDGAFEPHEALPRVDGPAQLFVFPDDAGTTEPRATHSAWEAFGSAPVLRTREDIDAQVREERASWGDR